MQQLELEPTSQEHSSIARLPWKYEHPAQVQQQQQTPRSQLAHAQRHWSDLLYYPLHVLDRALEAAKIFVAYQAVASGATVLQEGFKAFHQTAEAAADTASEAATVMQWFFGTRLISSVVTLAVQGKSAVQAFL